jgi:biotin transport system substrate-specific component
MHATAAALPRDLTRPLVLVLLGSLVVAVAAQVRIPLPFSPVPITLQTAAVVLVGATLGSRLGALALLAYVAEGALGLPVFAGGTGAGPAVLLGPTGGYLAGFVLAAFVAGQLAERGWLRTPLGALAGFLAASASVYVPALPWLAQFVGVERVLAAGLLPFVPGDLVKTVAAAALWAGGGRLTRR